MRSPRLQGSGAAEEVGDAAAVARFDPRSRARTGDQVDIAVRAYKLHFFDPSDHTSIWG